MADRLLSMSLEEISGFGRCPRLRARVSHFGTVEELRAGIGEEGPWIPQGNRRSYGDAALGPRVASLLPMKECTAFDPEAGVVRAGAGVTIADLISRVLPEGWFPPVVPGTGAASVGGCVAADVHGKNHHVDGSFGAFVRSLDMVLPDGRRVRTSREEEPDLFRATLGGMGLTGFITAVELGLRRVESAWVRQRVLRAPSLERCCDALEGELGSSRYSVAWIDGLRGGTRAGRGIVFFGDHAPRAETPGTDPLALPPTRVRRVPFDAPVALLQRLTVGAFNSLYYRVPRSDGLVRLDSFFHPLDRIDGWNRLYGRRGFRQYQCVVPFDGGRQAVAAVLDRLRRDTGGAFLCVLKTFGEGSEGVLSFPRPGYTLAADVADGRGVVEAFRACDRIVRERGGRVYLAKDSTLSREDFEAMNPELDEFRRIRNRYDPAGVLRSSMSDRLGITEPMPLGT